MLKQRVITAIVLLSILLPALFYGSAAPFCSVTLVLIAAGAWEWGRLNGYGQPMSVIAGVACVLLCAGSWWLGMLEQKLTWLWVFAGASWVLAGSWVLHRGVASWAAHSPALRLLAGLLALCLACLAVAQARAVGINFLLSVL
ncbi:MAG: phosphatidate cytidylyltransferase, partial [Rhodoferax sp.]